MASSGSLSHQKMDNQTNQVAAGFPKVSSIPRTSNYASKNQTASLRPPTVSKRIVGNSVHHKRVANESRKSFFQKYVPSAEREGGEGGDEKDGDGKSEGKKSSISPRRSNKNDSGSQQTKRSMNSLHPFWLKGLIVNKDRSMDSAEFWIENSIHCGYLHAYCLDERNIENIKFLMAVEAFKDELRSDVGVWQSLEYQSVDSILEIHKHVKSFDLDQQKKDMKWNEHISSDRWPSVRLSYSAIVAHIQKIWDTFLSAKAPLQICANAMVMGNTIFRLTRLDAYGTEVFEELCIDPFITIKRDVLPRFYKSIWFKKLNERLKTVETLPKGETFAVRPPRNSACLKLDIENVFLDDLKVPMDVLIHDGIYYATFMQYLESVVASELLLCARAFSTYHCFWVDQKGPLHGPNDSAPGADEAAWKIFRFFVAVGSAFEVSVSAKTRKSIMLHLAVPKIDMFNVLEKATNKALSHHLIRFYSTTYFLSIPERIRERQEEKKKKQEIRQATKVASGTPTMAVMLMGAVGGGTSSSPQQVHHKNVAIAPPPSPLFPGKTHSSLNKEENHGLLFNVQMMFTGVIGRGKTTPEMEILRPPEGIGMMGRQNSLNPALFGGAKGVAPIGTPPAGGTLEQPVSKQPSMVGPNHSTCLIS